jgi:hypothetical protein
MKQGLLEKLTVSQLVKKFPAFYGTRKFITAFTKARHLSLSWATSIQSMPPSHFLKIDFNIILPSTPGSPKWSPSLRSPYKKILYSPLFSPIRAICPASFINNITCRPSIVSSSSSKRTYRSSSSWHLNLKIKVIQADVKRAVWSRSTKKLRFP